jgi:RNA polymerase sigma-70 factor (ECF subfamily)
MASTDATVKDPTGEGSRQRRIIYCLLPPDLASDLHDPLRRHFRDDPDVEVVVEGRRRERRSGADRRRAHAASPGERERRRIKSVTGRRVAERRAALAPSRRPPPVLPPNALGVANRIVFLERLEPPTREAEDRDAARLVTRFQGGDPDAFSILYSRYFERVYGYLRVILRDADEAEDGAQQVFVNVFEALPAYERRGQPFRAWFMTIVRNVAFDCLRRRSRIEPRDAESIDSRLQQLERAELEPEMLRISDRELSPLLENLSPPQRQVILLRYVLGLSSAETGRVLGRSPVAVRGLQYRALRSLRTSPGGRRELAVPRAPGAPTVGFST